MNIWSHNCYVRIIFDNENIIFIFLEEPYGLVPEFEPKFETFFQKSIPCFQTAKITCWNIFCISFYIFRSSHQRSSMTKDVVKKFLIFTGKHLRNIKMQIFWLAIRPACENWYCRSSRYFSKQVFSNVSHNIHRKTLLWILRTF